MAEIAPFRGIRYNQSLVGDLSHIVCPPYDIISPEDRIYYHKLHANNFVRLILGEEFEADSEDDNRFTRAKQYIVEWLGTGILKRDEEPAIYVYTQHFEHDGRSKTIRGFTCAVKVHEYSERVILPHEHTLAKPRAGLRSTLEQTSANLDSIYGLYDDPRGELEAVLDRVTAMPPAADVVDRDGVRHTLRIVSDPGEIGLVQAFLKDEHIVIADGHHRYEAALHHRNRMHKPHSSAEQPSDYTLMTIVNASQKDLEILSTHRVIDSIASDVLAQLDSRLLEHFDVVDSSAQFILQQAEQLKGIGMYRKENAKILIPKPGVYEIVDECEACAKLELNILHKLILERFLGIDEEKLRHEAHVRYTRDADKAIHMVDTGNRQIAFLLDHIAVKSVIDIAGDGQMMPQKATVFYPKLLSGLVMRKMD